MENKCTCADCVTGKIQSVAGPGCSLPAHEFSEETPEGRGCWNCGALEPRPGERQRFYVGLSAGSREVFKSVAEPTEESHSQYTAVIGPFRTKRGAEFMRDFGAGNPHCRNVAEAEKLAAKEGIPIRREK